MVEITEETSEPYNSSGSTNRGAAQGDNAPSSGTITVSVRYIFSGNQTRYSNSSLQT